MHLACTNKGLTYGELLYTRVSLGQSQFPPTLKPMLYAYLGQCLAKWVEIWPLQQKQQENSGVAITESARENKLSVARFQTWLPL